MANRARVWRGGLENESLRGKHTKYIKAEGSRVTVPSFRTRTTSIGILVSLLSVAVASGLEFALLGPLCVLGCTILLSCLRPFPCAGIHCLISWIRF